MSIRVYDNELSNKIKASALHIKFIPGTMCALRCILECSFDAYVSLSVSIFCVLNFLYVLTYKTAASSIERMSAASCAQTNPVSPNPAGNTLFPAGLQKLQMRKASPVISQIFFSDLRNNLIELL